MTSPRQFEILDLRLFSANQLRPLLEQEAVVWDQRLRWDYRSSTELLLQYLDSRLLPGFVAVHAGRVCGYTFSVYEGRKAVIGDIYVSQTEPDPVALVQRLAGHLLETLEASPDVQRIEAQLLLFDEGILPPLIAASASAGARLQTFPRLFLELDVGSLPELAGTVSGSFPPHIEFCRWSPGFYNPTAELIQHAYAGHLDSSINDQYQTLAGSQRFLHNIIRFPGCGTFDPEASFVLRERRSQSLIAVVLCSRVASDTAHVTQLCVAPAQRGRHLGDALLRQSLRNLQSRGCRFITLTVSENNHSALRLYRATGFRTRYRFDAIVLDHLEKLQHHPMSRPPFPDR